MIPIPPAILLRIAALPKAIVADVLSIIADIIADFEAPQNTQNDHSKNASVASLTQQNTQVEAFEHTQKTQNAAFEAQVAPFCQVPEVPPKSNIKPLPNPPSYLVQEIYREEGSKENKALPRKASTLTAARAREFEEFWAAFPKRINKQAAIKRFEVALKQVSFEHLINAAKRYASATQSTEKQYIKAPDVWLNKGCYDDELPLANGEHHAIADADIGIRVELDTPQWEAWDSYWRKTKGKSPPCHNGGWRFPSEWPPT